MDTRRGRHGKEVGPSRAWIGTLAVATAVTVACAAPPAADAATTNERPLARVLLTDDGVPRGWRRTVDLGGSLGTVVRDLGAAVSGDAPDAGYPSHARAWQHGSGHVIFELATRYPSARSAAAALCGAAERAEERGFRLFELDEPPDAKGYVQPLVEGSGAVQHLAVFRRGDIVFTLRTGPEAASEDEAIRTLARRQGSRVPDVGSSPRCAVDRWELGGRMVGAAAALTATYLSGVWFVAWIRDPLRRRRRSDERPGTTPASDPRVQDVTDVAAAAKRRARRRTALQLVGLFLAAPALVPFLWPDAAASAVAGLLVGFVAPRLLLRRTEPTSRPGIGAVARGRLLLAGIPAALAAGAIGAGLLLLLGSALTSASDVTEEELGVDPAVMQGVMFVLGIALLVVGSSLWVFARRLAASRARALLDSDPRRPVLFLRSFGDDRLRIRTAAAGRAALLSRLSPRRFARFEEVVARRLLSVGPVVAVNRPGTRLAPLGAARETLSDDAWQKTVGTWIDDATLIAVAAAPSKVPRGLEWELRQLSDRKRWDDTLLVLPPILPEELRTRWALFTDALGLVAPIRDPLPADPAAVLVCRLTNDGRWTAATAARRDEWSYSAALGALTDGGRRGVESA